MRPLLVLATLTLGACTAVPGETTAPRSIQGAVQDKVLALARSADPQCKQPKISTTEIIDVHPDGRSASEVWVVEQCGRRANYVVSFPPRKGASFSVQPER